MQTASYGDLLRLSKWHVCTFVGRHALGMQVAVCNRRSCQVIETPTQRSHEYLEPSVKVGKFEPKIRPETPKKVPLALNIPKQVKGTTQNRIFWLRPPPQRAQRLPKRPPKYPSKTLPHASKRFEGPTERCIGSENLENHIF